MSIFWDRQTDKYIHRPVCLSVYNCWTKKMVFVQGTRLKNDFAPIFLPKTEQYFVFWQTITIKQNNIWTGQTNDPIYLYVWPSVCLSDDEILFFDN